MHSLRPVQEAMSVKQLKLLAKGSSCEQLSEIIGEFVLVRRPPEQVMKKRLMDLEMGATRPVRRIGTGAETLVLEFLFDFEELEVIPAPTARDLWKVGRSTEVDLVMDHPSVSKAHATIRKGGGGFLLRDTGSTNGTFIDDLPVHQEGKALHDGAVVSFGDLDFWFLLTTSLYERLA